MSRMLLRGCGTAVTALTTLIWRCANLPEMKRARGSPPRYSAMRAFRRFQRHPSILAVRVRPDEQSKDWRQPHPPPPRPARPEGRERVMGAEAPAFGPHRGENGFARQPFLLRPRDHENRQPDRVIGAFGKGSRAMIFGAPGCSSPSTSAQARQIGRSGTCRDPPARHDGGDDGAGNPPPARRAR